MRILHFILGKASKDKANGVNQVVAGLAKYSSRAGAEIRVIGKATSGNRGGERLQREDFVAEVFCGWTSPLRKRLREGIAWADLVHLHGGYSPWNLLVGRTCQELGKPYFITLHDALSPERAHVRGHWKKAMFHALLQRKHLESAAGIHVLTEEEGTDLFSALRPRKVYCIPNGIDPEEYPDQPAAFAKEKRPILIGYLGRLSAEKNLGALCEAFTCITGPRDSQLQIVGPPSEYGQVLAHRFRNQGIDLLGPKYGSEKLSFLREVDLLVLPSISEGFSIVAAEALALRTPLLVTRGSKMTYFYDQNAFFMCEGSTFGLRRGMEDALSRRDEWISMTTRGRALVDRRLNWAAIAAKMLDAYKDVLGVTP
jgi:glycosyltransferase involved in cell wall biosynthesis